MPRDLRFAWEEMPQQMLDVQAQKVRESLHAALIAWAEAAGGGSDYTDNLPLQCLHPVGHWFEVPNLLRNGTLARLLAERPQLKYLMLHNIDTLGADLDPGLLGLHIQQEACLTFEVIGRRIEDRGGGLARVNGRVRLVEGLAMPREEDEFRLTLLQLDDDLDHHRQAAGGLRAGPRRSRRRAGRDRGDPPIEPADAHLHHPEGREEALGARPGGHLPRGPVREALGRHDRAARSRLPFRRRSPACAASSSRSRPNSTAGSATARRPMWTAFVRGTDRSGRSPTACRVARLATSNASAMRRLQSSRGIEHSRRWMTPARRQSTMGSSSD